MSSLTANFVAALLDFIIKIVSVLLLWAVAIKYLYS